MHGGWSARKRNIGESYPRRDGRGFKQPLGLGVSNSLWIFNLGFGRDIHDDYERCCIKDNGVASRILSQNGTTEKVEHITNTNASLACSLNAFLIHRIARRLDENFGFKNGNLYLI